MLNIADSKDGKGRTIWQIITGQNKKVVTVVNPLELKVCDFLNFHGLHDNYVVTKITPTQFYFEAINHLIDCVDYELTCNGKEYVLRYENEKYTYKLLEVFDHFPYSEDFEEIFVEDDNFHITEDKNGNPCEDVYFSENRLIFKARLGDEEISYRDYVRSINESGETEFLTVERSERTGMFRILIGKNVTNDSITVFKG